MKVTRWIFFTLFVITLVGCTGIAEEMERQRVRRLQSCTAGGTYFQWGQARKLQIGMTTSEVTQLLGRPYSVQSMTTAKGSQETWTWICMNPYDPSNHRNIWLIFIEDKLTGVPKVPDSFQD